MSLLASYAGGTLLALATIPQAVRLLRTRSAHDIGWAFAALNFVGLALLTYRSLDIREWGFFGVNVVTTTFWGLVLAVKALPGAPLRPARTSTTPRPETRPRTLRP